MDKIKAFLQEQLCGGASLNELMNQIAAAANTIEAEKQKQDIAERPWAYGADGIFDALERVADESATIEDAIDIFFAVICLNYPALKDEFDKDSIDSFKKMIIGAMKSLNDLATVANDDSMPVEDKLRTAFSCLCSMLDIKQPLSMDKSGTFTGTILNADSDAIAKFITSL